MLAQLLDVLLELSLFIIVAIIAGALSSYFLIMRYDSDIENIPKEQTPDEYFIRLDELQETLAKGGIESEKVQEVMKQMEKRLAVYDQHEYLRNFFLPTELKVFQVMADHLLEDGPVPYGEYLLYPGGWRNKNEIWEASGVPKKSIYGRNNILVRFTVLGLAKQRPSISKWGRQKFQYKLNAENLTVKDYVGVLRDSKIE
ncbi:MAG: hypothetical protein RTU63_08610 [Candidatus Thorarchaeota archaeon]